MDTERFSWLLIQYGQLFAARDSERIELAKGEIKKFILAEMVERCEGCAVGRFNTEDEADAISRAKSAEQAIADMNAKHKFEVLGYERLVAILEKDAIATDAALAAALNDLAVARDECDRLTGSRINTEAMLKAVIESKETARRLAEEECAMLRKSVQVVDIGKAGEPTQELLELAERQRTEADEKRVKAVARELCRLAYSHYATPYRLEELKDDIRKDFEDKARAVLNAANEN